VLGFVALFLSREHAIAHDWGFSLDDSWIHATIARNIATGHGFSFNPDEPVAGSTGPLYTFLLAAIYAVFHEVVWGAKLLGTLCQCASALLVFSAGRNLDPRGLLRPTLAGLLVGLSPPLLWSSVSGMEISLYLLFVCLGLYFYTKGRDIAATLAWALGVWVRPDGLFLVALALVTRRERLGRRLAVALPVLLLFFAFNMAVGGTPFPQTVGAKSHFGIDLANRTARILFEWLVLWDVPLLNAYDAPLVALLFLMVGAGVIATFRRYPILALYAIGSPVALSLFRDSSGQQFRYILYVIPFEILLALAGLDTLARLFTKRSAPAIVLAVGMTWVGWQGYESVGKATQHGWNVQNINSMQRLLGSWAGRVTKPGDRIATNDVGAIGYFGGRYVVDLMGLVSPPRPMPENLARYKPELVLVFVAWFKDYVRVDPVTRTLAFYDPDSTYKYAAIGGVELKNNTVCASSRMLVFQRMERDRPLPGKKWFYRL